MKEILNIDFNQVANRMTSSEVFGDELIISNLRQKRDKRRDLENMPTIRLEAVVFFICTRGSISFRIDYTECHLRRNMLLQLSRVHTVNNVRMSDDFDGYMVAVSSNLTRLILEDTQNMKKLYVSLNRSVLLIELSEQETNCLMDIIVRMKKMMTAYDHAFQNGIIKNEVSNFLLEMANIYVRKTESGKIANDTITRKEDVAQNFISLVFSHCKREHEVSFYAEKLCMTTGNLCRIMKAISGKTAIQWISDARVVESKLLLQNPNTNIQQIAEELHFGDQSSFGKFFRKHTGYTPTEYRSKEK